MMAHIKPLPVSKKTIHQDILLRPLFSEATDVMKLFDGVDSPQLSALCQHCVYLPPFFLWGPKIGWLRKPQRA